MKKILAVLTLGIASVAVSSAAPVCGFTTLANYIALGSGGCTIGDKLFFNFNAFHTAAGGAATPTNGDIVVGPFVGLNTPGILLSTGAWTAFAGQFVNSSVVFSVRILDPLKTFDSVGLAFAASTNGQNTGAIVSETVWYGAGKSLQTSVFNVNGEGVGSSTTPKFPAGVKEITVLKDILVTAATAQGPQDFAKISIVGQSFNQTAVPEPATMAAVGAALVALGLARRARS